MAKILLATSAEQREFCTNIFNGHELYCTDTIFEAKQLLQSGQYDLIICTVLFDESRMFDLLKFAKSTPKWKRIPFICGLVRTKLLDYPLVLEGVEIASKALGAEACFYINNYERNNEGEMPKYIENLLQRPNQWNENRSC